MDLMIESLPRLLIATKLTIELTLLSLFFGIFVGVFFAILRTSKNKIFCYIAYYYSYIFRGTPLLVQIFIIYFGLGQVEWIRESFLWIVLKEVQNSSIEVTEKLKTLFKKIKKVNQNLWDIEDKLRFCEKNKDFGKNFIELARGVYFNNDKRSKIKSEINKILMSNIKEVKEYAQY